MSHEEWYSLKLRASWVNYLPSFANKVNIHGRRQGIGQAEQDDEVLGV